MVCNTLESSLLSRSPSFSALPSPPLDVESRVLSPRCGPGQARKSWWEAPRTQAMLGPGEQWGRPAPGLRSCIPQASAECQVQGPWHWTRWAASLWREAELEGEAGGLPGRTAHSPCRPFPAPPDPAVPGHQRGGPAGCWRVTRAAGEQVLGLALRHGGSAGASWVAGTCFM